MGKHKHKYYACLLTYHNPEICGRKIFSRITNTIMWGVFDFLPRRHRIPFKPECDEWWCDENYSGNEDRCEIKMPISREFKMNSQAWIIAYVFLFVLYIFYGKENWITEEVEMNQACRTSIKFRKHCLSSIQMLFIYIVFPITCKK